MLDTMMNKNDREEFHCVISDIILFASNNPVGRTLWVE